MQVPVQITFRGMDTSPAVESRIRDKVKKLETFHDRITSCHVVIEAPHKRHQKGKLYLVSIDVTVPGRELVVNTGKRFNHSHEDVYVALRDAFNAIHRQLETHFRESRGQVKAHDVPPHGVILRLFPDHGFIGTPQLGEVYFHRNSVVDAQFDDLEEGTEVRFSTAQGEKGMQATTVHVVGKQHVVER
ncbi:MAG: HPF/RaiA family ribosome-associated protein [Rhodospirillales bacterium]|nr:MAG: HPF/RaiA family ribosome-associated protein [Rhodospirillales bacterium]